MNKEIHLNSCYPGIFTLLGLSLNAFRDQRNDVTVGEIMKRCEDYTLIQWLEKNIPASLSLWDDETKIIMAEEFASLANVIIAEDDYSVSKDGISLLIAFCFEFIQHKPTRTLDDCDFAKTKLKEIGTIK